MSSTLTYSFAKFLDSLINPYLLYSLFEKAFKIYIDGKPSTLAQIFNNGLSSIKYYHFNMIQISR